MCAASATACPDPPGRESRRGYAASQPPLLASRPALAGVGAARRPDVRGANVVVAGGLRGGLRTGYVGVVTALSARWLAGLAVARNSGWGGWRAGSARGSLSTSLTAAYPYLHWSAGRDSVDAQGRLLMLHSVSGCRERGVRVTLRVGNREHEGLSLSVSPTWGDAAAGGGPLWQEQVYRSYLPEATGDACGRRAGRVRDAAPRRRAADVVRLAEPLGLRPAADGRRLGRRAL